MSKTDEKFSHLHLRYPADMHKALGFEALERDTSRTQIIVEVLRAHLGMDQVKAPTKMRKPKNERKQSKARSKARPEKIKGRSTGSSDGSAEGI